MAQKKFDTPEDLYKHMKSEDNPFGLGVGARRNTNKEVLGIIWDAAYACGRRDEKKGEPPKGSRKCACGCGAEIARSQKRATLPGHSKAA